MSNKLPIVSDRMLEVIKIMLEDFRENPIDKKVRISMHGVYGRLCQLMSSNEHLRDLVNRQEENKPSKDELSRVKEVLGTFIAWSAPTLGMQSAQELLDMLNK